VSGGLTGFRRHCRTARCWLRSVAGKAENNKEKKFLRSDRKAIDLPGDPAKLHAPGTAVERLSASGCSLAIRQLISFGFGRHAIVTGTDKDHPTQSAIRS
jgi:hypothetical protein